MTTGTFLQASKNQSELLVQDYQRSDCQASIIHLGVGAFHRAHQAVYFDRLMALAEGKKWGITGVNIRPQDSELFGKLMAQNGEYVLKTMDAAGLTTYEHIRSILSMIDGSQNPLEVDLLMADSATQLVTCTVTEGGYFLDETHKLILDHADIAGDLGGQRNTLYSFLYAGLKQRSINGENSPITLLCCDNLRENGHLLRTGLMQFIAARGDEDLALWLEKYASFPCAMVDRITPKPSVEHMTQTQEYFGIHDQMTVMAESYIQWVIEDNFAGERPSLDLVGVQFVESVTPYEEAKIRILNAGHTCVTYQAALKGLKYFDEAMVDPELGRYFDAFIKQEAVPALGQSIVDLGSYSDIIKQRFMNAYIGDTVERICADGYAKFPIFVWPTLRGIYQQGRVPTNTLQGIAAWFVFYQHYQAGKLSIHYNEPSMAAMAAFTHDEKGIKAFSSNRYLWGEVLDQYPSFQSDLASAIEQMSQAYPL